MNRAARIRSRTAARDLHPRHHRWTTRAAPSRASRRRSSDASSGGGRDANAKRRARLHRVRTASRTRIASLSASAFAIASASARIRASCASLSFLVSFRSRFAAVLCSFSSRDAAARSFTSRARCSRASARAAAAASLVSFLCLVSEATCAPMWSTPVRLALASADLSDAARSLFSSALNSSGSFASFSTRAATCRRTPAARFRAFTGGE
mmetsp:Transcript_3109/g.11585  ORF Transcript_3109/g.11585 Transcript_3109/m.11585 type:complete len:210 (+) Transcript_3109:3058-3687(+)